MPGRLLRPSPGFFRRDWYFGMLLDMAAEVAPGSLAFSILPCIILTKPKLLSQKQTACAGRGTASRRRDNSHVDRVCTARLGKVDSHVKLAVERRVRPCSRGAGSDIDKPGRAHCTSLAHHE